jgi:hypothetical protein
VHCVLAQNVLNGGDQFAGHRRADSVSEFSDV